MGGRRLRERVRGANEVSHGRQRGALRPQFPPRSGECKKMIRFTKVFNVLVALVLLGVAIPAFAQKKDKKEKENQRQVIGHVVDKESNPIEGAVVQLKDVRT